MRRPDPRLLLLMALAGLFLGGCTAQVSGMQSPVLHDYGPLDWILLDREIEQSLIFGTGYSAAIENDPATTSRQLQARLAALPPDATSGDLVELRIGLRHADTPHGRWATDARIQVAVTGLSPARTSTREVFIDASVDDLPRTGERVILRDFPDLDAGSVLHILLLPGDGPQSVGLEFAITPDRAPYGGWRATSDGDVQRGALVYETRYQRNVSPSGVLEAAFDRLTGADSVFAALWGLSVLGLAAGVVVVSRKREGGNDGR